MSCENFFAYRFTCDRDGCYVTQSVPGLANLDKLGAVEQIRALGWDATEDEQFCPAHRTPAAGGAA
jgi:hypothetical protein